MKPVLIDVKGLCGGSVPGFVGEITQDFSSKVVEVAGQVFSWKAINSSHPIKKNLVVKVPRTKGGHSIGICVRFSGHDGRGHAKDMVVIFLDVESSELKWKNVPLDELREFAVKKEVYVEV